jgi:two-component system, OmpR family, response regulator
VDATIADQPLSPSPAAVLVVDDDRDTRALLRTVLQDADYTVYEAHNGMSALSWLRSHPYPLVVLLDWWMPGLDGLHVLQALAEDAPSLPQHIFLVMTAASDALTRRLMCDIAAIPADLSVTLLAKPFHLNDILGFVARAEAQLLASI